MLEYARLRVRAIEQRDLRSPHALGDQRLDLLDDEAGLLDVGHRLEDADRLALALGRPQILAQALAIVGDHRIGCGENIAVRAIVLFQLDDALDMNSRSKCCMLATLAPRKA